MCSMRSRESPSKAEVEEDDQERARFLGGKVFSGRKKSWGSKIEDGGTTVDGAIGAYGSGIGDSSLVPSLYAYINFIYRSSWKGEMASEAKRYLDKSSEGSGEVFPGEAGE
ncbi:hypothetical protein Tco_1150733 [Tanacetum coccineum]